MTAAKWKSKPKLPPVDIRDPYAAAWVWRYSRTRKLLQHLMLTIARAMKWRGSRYETDDLPAATLSERTGYHEDTVNGAVRRLETDYGDEIEVIKPRRRGESFRFRLRTQGTLPLDEAGCHPAEDRMSPGRGPDVTRSGTGCHPVEDRVDPDQDQGKREKEKEAAPTVNLADEVANWIADKYRGYHGGQPHMVTAARLRKVHFLLGLYAADYLKELAGTMWTVRPEEDVWLALKTPDRGIDLLYARHERLDVITRARQATPSDANTPTHDDPATSESVHDRHWPAVCEGLTQLGLPLEEIAHVKACTLMSVDDGVAHIWVPLAQVPYFGELETRPEKKQVVEAPMRAELGVSRVGYRYEVKRPASAAGEG